MNVIDSFKLEGKVVVVTGGAGHLGHAMVCAFSEAGASHIYVLGRKKEKFDSIFKDSNNIHFLNVDICNTDSVIDCFKVISQNHTKIDVLVNNAAFIDGGGKLPENLTDDMWTNTLNGVVTSVARCIKCVLPYMKKGGCIINISSMYGLVSPNLSMYEGVCSQYLNPIHYGAAKAAVIQMTKYYGTYLIEKGIRVNCITPGTFPSIEVQNNQEFIKRLCEKNPAKRIGKPDDLKGAVVFLASEASNYIIGQNIIIDGGWTIW